MRIAGVFLLFCLRRREDPKWHWDKLSQNILIFAFFNVVKAVFCQKMRKFRNHCTVIWWQKSCREAFRGCCRVCAVFPQHGWSGDPNLRICRPWAWFPPPYSLFTLLESSDGAEPGWSQPGSGAGWVFAWNYAWAQASLSFQTQGRLLHSSNWMLWLLINESGLFKITTA